MRKIKKPALVVALHDVTPAFSPQIKLIVNRLQEIGLHFFVLKVIPDFQGRADLRSDRDFLDWLHQLTSSGCEIVLHGFRHVKSKTGERTDSFCQNFLTKGEDEFSALNEDKAREYLLKAREILAEAGLKCSGFTPPTWRLSRQAFHALKKIGFSYLTTFTRIIDLKHSRDFFAPAFGHQGILPCLESLMGIGNNLGRIFLMPHLALIRIILHPRGLEHPNFNSSLRLIAKLLPICSSTTYGYFLGS